MSFGEIIGQDAALEFLDRARRSGRIPHAMLFQGPEGVGKGTVARALAAGLVCEREDGDACGACAACTRTRHGAHPDVLVVRRLPKKVREAGPMSDASPAGDASGADDDLSPFIRVFQIRQLSEHAAYAPREAPYRVFVVDPADRMNAESQNCLLKTLEEPPGRSIIILVASRPHLLFGTVRSRCVSVGFGVLPAAELAARLEERGIPRTEALERAALSAGRPGRALALDLDTLRARREAVVSMVVELAGSPGALARLPSLSSTLAGRSPEDLVDQLELLEGLLRDAARAAVGLPADSLLHADLAGPVAEMGRRLGARRAAELVRSLERLKSDLRFNLNRALAADSVLAALGGGPLP